MRVALVHDYLREYGDAERTLQGLHRLYPEAPVYTAFVDYQRLGQEGDRFTNWDIRPTFAHQLPGVTRHYQTYRSLLPYFWESLDLADYDLVISSSGGYSSQAVLTRSATLHVSYCYGPPRYLWEPISSPLRSWFDTWTNTRLRQYDFYAAQRVDLFVTHSDTAAYRIRQFYRRPVEVIYPPVPILGHGEAGKDYYLCVGSLDPSQQVELAIAACTQLNRPLWVVSRGQVGRGSEMERLQQVAGSTVRFLGAVSDEAMAEIYEGAIALINPSAYEDFAFAPVEAMGRGIPVIASSLSGLKNIILDYRTGLLFPQPTVDSLSQAILQFEKLRFSSQACIERAEEFAESVFTTKFEWFIAKALDDHRQQGEIALEANN